jgi:glutaredoxin
MYTVRCKNCDNYYESKVNRSGICPDCKITVRGRTNTKYREKNYDRLTVYVPKGKREELKEYVSRQNMSINEFINTAIEHYMEEIEANDEYVRTHAMESSDDEIPF